MKPRSTRPTQGKKRKFDEAELDQVSCCESGSCSGSSSSSSSSGGCSNDDYGYGYAPRPAIKKGRTTGLTVGQWNELEADVRYWYNPGHSAPEVVDGRCRIVLTPKVDGAGQATTPFARPGDSGAVVFDERGRAAGLLTAAARSPRQKAYYFAAFVSQLHVVQPLERVLRDVERTLVRAAGADNDYRAELV